ncbi:hypothetical protein FS749_000247, partial [Ceratobasidium sp. UAMH 11750]
MGKIKRVFKRIEQALDRSPSVSQPSTPPAQPAQPTHTPATPAINLQSPPEVLNQPSAPAPVTAASNQQSHVSNQGPSAAPILPASSAGGQSTEREGWAGLKTFADLLSKGASMCGPLKQAVDGVLTSVETFEVAAKNREDYQTLRTELNTLFHDLAGYFGASIPPAMTSSIINLAQGIERELELIRRERQRSEAGRYVNAKEDADDVLECYRRIQGLLTRLTLNANVNIWKTVDEQATENRLKNLPNSPDAKYNSSEAANLRRGECTNDTRVELLDELYGWACDDKSQRIYWLNGMAGTGKTTVAYSLCGRLQKSKKLAASFFCSRQLPECRRVKYIVPTISYQLSLFSLPFRYALSRALAANPEAHNQPLIDQFRQLILEPLDEIKESLPTDLIVVIDALDECEDDEGVGRILNVLLSHAHDLPLKFFVASRPDAKILD